MMKETQQAVLIQILMKMSLVNFYQKKNGFHSQKEKKENLGEK